MLRSGLAARTWPRFSLDDWDVFWPDDWAVTTAARAAGRR